MTRRCTQLGMLLVVLAAPMAAHAGTAAEAVVRGVVRSPQGVPQMGAIVQLLSPDATAIATAITDLNGRYRMRGVAPGRYQMRASATLFLPALRRNLRLASGAQATVNLTLTALIGEGRLLAAKRRDPSDADDDWKWTLRAAENRPVLRVLPDGTALIVPGRRDEGRQGGLAERRVVATAGSGEFAGGGIHTVVLADHAGEGSSAEMLRADVGAGQAPSITLGSGYERGLGYAGKVRFAAIYQNHPELTAGKNSGLSALSLVNAEKMRLGDAVAVEVGSLMRSVRSPSASAWETMPFLNVSAEPVRGLMITYRMATARELQSFDDLDSLRPVMPVAVAGGSSLQMERGRHHEISVTERVGSGTVQAAVYRDHFDSSMIAGVGLPDADAMAAGGVLVDTVTGTFRVLGSGYDANGISISISEPLTQSLWISGEYDNGDALAGDAPGDVHPEWSQAGLAAVEGRWKSGTRLRVSYRWQPAGALTAVDSYRRDAERGYLGIFLRQPLRYHHVLPEGLEAVVDVSNLLAQGYRPIGISADGGTLFLAQTARSVQGGLAFTF